MNTTYKKNIINLFFIFICCVLFAGCSINITTKDEPMSRTQFVLGTTVTITLYTEQSEETLDEAFNNLSDIEKLLSINKDDTLIDKINQNAGISPVAVDESTFNLIKKALHYSDVTSGAFDITVGPLVRLWHIGFPDEKVPEIDEINKLLPLVDYNMVTLDEKNKTVFLNKKGMMLDLGGIGKGYAADETASLLRDKGVKHAIINLGGNVYTLGDKPGNKLWTIGVQNPNSPRGNAIGTIEVSNKSLVTSGIYERYITAEDGTRYHHILNPDTGFPFDNKIAGVTIISDSSTDGDALSTAVFALGITEGIKFIENQANIDAIFISTDKDVYITSGLKGNFKLTDPEFNLIN